MFAIKNKENGRYLSKMTPLLYAKRGHAESAIKAILRDGYAEYRGYKNLGLSFEAVEVGLIEITPRDELPLEDIPMEWGKLGSYP